MMHTHSRSAPSSNRSDASSGEASSEDTDGATSRLNRAERLLKRVEQLVSEGRYEQALNELKPTGAISDGLKNAKGVCLLRLDRIDAAVAVYRTLVLQPDCTWMKPHAPIIHKTNFATALLLSRHTAGAASVLAEIADQEHPSVRRLWDAIGKWKAELSWWRRMLWWCGSEPTHPVKLDFIPGELHDPVTQPAEPAEPIDPALERRAA